MEYQFKGSCGIERMEELKGSLLTAIQQNATVTIDFEEVTDVDLTFFLLIHSAVKTAATLGKELELKTNISHDMAVKAVWAGLPQIANPELRDVMA